MSQKCAGDPQPKFLESITELLKTWLLQTRFVSFLKLKEQLWLSKTTCVRHFQIIFTEMVLRWPFTQIPVNLCSFDEDVVGVWVVFPVWQFGKLCQSPLKLQIQFQRNIKAKKKTKQNYFNHIALHCILY